MEKRKLDLKSLKVKSFITEDAPAKSNTVKGGTGASAGVVQCVIDTIGCVFPTDITCIGQCDTFGGGGCELDTFFCSF